jgi:aerotolerance regulator-like protein/VWA domain-containing protein
MSFLSPLYLVGAALIALPIVLHLLRRDVAPPLPFTAVRLLRVSPIERSRRRRLRDVLLLLARVAALLLLAGSFARPYRAGASSSTRTTVVAVDRSLSMSAPGVMEKARALARRAVNEAGADPVAVIAFDQHADVVAPAGSAADARLAIDEIQPSFGATRYASAFDKAADLLPDRAPGRLIVVGDLQRSGFDGSTASLPQGVELVVRDAGGASANLAVTDIRPEPRRLLATIGNFGSAPRETDVRLEVAGRTEVTRRVTVPPATSLDVPFEAVSRAAVDVAVSDADGFAGDNVRYALTDSRGAPRVLIVSGGPGSTAGFYLARALEAEDESGTGFAVRTVHGPEFTAMTAADVAHYSVVAILSTHALDRRVRDSLRTFLSAGGGLLIAAAPDVDPSVLSTVLDWQPALTARDRSGAGVLAVSDLRHPIFRPFDAVAANLGQVSFQRAWQLQPGASWRVIASYTQGMPALVERAAGQGRIVLFTSDLDRRWNDFPLHPAFVPFVQETVRYLGARAPETATYLVADVPAGVPARPGIVQTEGRTLAVNIDVRESALDRVTPAQFTALVARSASRPSQQPARAAQQTEARQGFWRYGLMLMLAALVAECFVGSR